MSKAALRFESEDELLVALRSGWIPADVASAPAWVKREDGAIVIAPSVTLAAAKAKKHGIASAVLKGGDEIVAWPQAIAVKRLASAGLDAGTVVFLVPSSEQIAHLAGELLRLGCDRLEIRLVGERALIRAVAAPFHTVARALDRVDGLRVFRTVGERVLIELGYEHPMPPTPADGAMVLITPDRWELLPDGPFEDLLPHVHLIIASEPRAVGKAAEVPRIEVPLRLARAARRADATLWIVKKDALVEVERFVRSTPEEITHRYLFAVTDEKPPRVLLRTRPGDRGTAEPAVGADAFASHPQVPNLFVPIDATIEPPLRHERLRALLAPDSTQLSIVRREPFGIEKVSDDAFEPLSAFVDYLVDRNAPELVTWIQGTTFAFTPFVVEDRPMVLREDVDDAPAPKPKKGKLKAPEPEPEKPAPKKRGKRDEQAAPTIAVAEVPVNQAAEALAALEGEFLELDAPVDDPARTPMWLRIAELNTQLRRPRDAGHAFVRALWESREPDPSVVKRWIAAEGSIDVAATLQKTHVSVDEARAVVAHVLSSEGELDTPGLVKFFDKFDPQLDIRTMWLGRARIARRAKDALLLARARDRALARLAQGLSLERDVPTFLRLFDRGSQNAHRLAEELDGVRARILAVNRTRSPVEAKPPLTMAYVELSIAWGLARLGNNERARELAKTAAQPLTESDPVHAYLIHAYKARIEQALAGAPPHTPLPASIGSELNALEKFLRYKVDRLRQASSILEPLERLDPIGAFQRGDTDPRGDELGPLRALEDTDALATALERIIVGAIPAPPERRARLFDGVLDFLPQLPESRAIALGEKVLAQIADVPPLPRAQLFEEILRVGGHFGNATLVRSSLDALMPLVRGFEVAQVGDLAQLLGGAVRALRRVGLRDDATRILEAVQALAKGDSIPSLVAQVQVAGGLCGLGLEAEARPSFERAVARLGGEVTVPDRLLLTRTVARGVATADPAFALAVLRRLEAQLPKITDSYNTNSHFCLSVIAFAEALIMGYVSDDLALGDRARRFFDEDEHLVRRRIHREVRA